MILEGNCCTQDNRFYTHIELFYSRRLCGNNDCHFSEYSFCSTLVDVLDVFLVILVLTLQINC